MVPVSLTGSLSHICICLPDEQLAWQRIEQGQRQGCRAGRGSRGGSGTLAPPSNHQNDNHVDNKKDEVMLVVATNGNDVFSH